jgi:pilus assembly protein CpaC
VGLGFTPVVLSSGRISLRLSTEVSELTNNGAYTIQGANGQGFSIPALNVRRAETTIELPSGEAMMIAGLLQEKTRQSIDSLPGVMNLPVLGSLFRSRDYVSGETELVIIVQPFLVSGAHPSRLQTPVDGMRMASEPEAVLLGKLTKRARAPGAPPPAAYQGPVGYVIE